MDLGPAGLLLACVVCGFGLTYLCGLELVFEERLFFGAVVGAMVVTLSGFAIASFAGFSVASVWMGAAIGLALSAAGWAHGRRRVPVDLTGVKKRWARPPWLAGHPWPLLAVAAVCGLYTVRLMSQAYVTTPVGLYAGQLGVWGDWAAHLSYAGSFAYGRNFPPEFPIDPGHRLGYPFMVDFLAASLVPLGASLTRALVLSSGFLGLVFPAVFYLAGLRLLGGRAAAAIAVFVFLLSGGLGFLYFLGDLERDGLGLLSHLPREYTHIPAQNVQWLNPVLANLLPQRSTLFGFSFALIALAILYTARERPGWTPFAFAGVLIGIAPSFHVHAYGTVIALAVFWALLNRRRAWLAFFLPALVLGVPVVAWMFPPVQSACEAGQPCILGLRVQVGWLAAADGAHDSIPWFWLKNLGLFIPLLIAAQIGLGRSAIGLHFAPLWLWFLVPNVVLFHPWDWDNNKFFVFWALLGSLLVGDLLARLFRAGPRASAWAGAMLVVLCLSGALDLARSLDYRISANLFTDTAGVRTAAWVRSHTDPRATFLVSTNHNQPVSAFTGRRVVLGYGGWVWSYGLSDWQAKEDAVHRMLQGTDPQDVARYHVNYVVIGPQERAAPYSANEDYWRGAADLVHVDGPYLVFRVRPG